MIDRSAPMQLTRRRLLGGLAIVGGASLMAACGGAPAPGAAPTAAPAKSAAPAATTAPKAAKPAAKGTGPKILLRLNGIAAPAQEFINKFIADYNASNNVNVEIDYTDWASSFQKITTGIAGGTAPDIFMGGGLWTPVIASKNASLELDAYIKKDLPDWNDWYEICRQDVTYKGKIQAIPYRMNHRGTIIYRKSLFEKAGLDPAKPPATWEEAYTMAGKLTQKQGDKYDVAGWYIAMPPPDLSQQYEDALYQAGGNYFSDDRTKPLNNTPEGKEALQFWVNFVGRGVVPKEGMDAGVPNLHAYSAGKIALFPGWPGNMLNTKLNAPQIWEDTLVAPPLKHKEQRLQVYVDKYIIYRRTKVPDEAFALVKALVSGEAGIKVGLEADWGMPARKEHETAEIYKDPRLKVFVENVRFGKPRQVVPQHFDVQPAMGRHVEAAIHGAKTVEQALKDMDDEVLKIIKG